MLGASEGKVILPRVGTADSRRACALYCLAARVPGAPRDPSARPSEPRPMTGRGSDTLDLATTFRLSAGDDITPQSCGVSSRKEIPKWNFSEPSRGRGGRKVGASGHVGYETPACSNGPSS